MEPLMPSEVARLVYGYLKEEKNDDTAECFLKSSPHLTECYQSFKANRKFNTKVNGFTLHSILDIFGTICNMSNVLVLIKERLSEKCESKTLLEKLQCLLDENHTLTKEDKCESFETPKETYNISKDNDLNTSTLDKALDSSPCDPQIKNTLDEFLVFNVNNAENDENACTNDQLNDSIKSRLRSARKKDDITSSITKNNFNIPKPIMYANEDCIKVDNNIVLIHEGNIGTTVFENNYDLLSNQFVLQSSDSYKFDPTRKTIEPEDHCAKTEYVKIAPKITYNMPNQASNRLIFPKRRKQSLEGTGIRSKFRRAHLTKQPLVQTPKPIIIEVPNQNSFENQERNHVEINDAIKLPEVLSKTDTVTFIHDTPDDRLKPPKNKSMSTPRRRSTHIRCLDFSTPQPKNMTRNEARSKLFYGTPKRLETCLEEPSPSSSPKLQASVNRFESMIKEEMIKRKKHWDSDIREMVGAGILTSDADGRRTRKKKTPRKKIKSVHVQNKSIDLQKNQEKSSNSITTNELHTDLPNISQNPYDVLTEQDSNRPLLDYQKPIKEQTKIPISLETPNNVTELYNKQPPVKSDSLNTLNDLKSLKELSEFPTSLETPDKINELYSEQAPTISGTVKTPYTTKLLEKQNELLISLETPDKITDLYNQQLPTTSNPLENTNKKVSHQNQSEISISLETPDKTTEMYTNQLLVKSDSLKNGDNEKSLKSPSEFLIPSETPDKITKFNNKQQLIKSNSSKSQCATQINPEQSYVNLKEQNINQNQLINSFNLKTVPDIPNQDKDPNFTKMFNNQNYSLIENNSNELTKHLIDQSSLDKKDTNNSSELNSPIKCINTDSIKPKLFETPYKCDDAVDVPETPISKLIREYDPSKLVTPLPCTPEHNDNSLTETPLTKVFRETSYLNRPQISPFPPTPGNSMSVDTLFIPQERDYIKISNNTTIEMKDLKKMLTQPIQTTTTDKKSSTKRKIEKVECIPSKSKVKLSTKSKIKNECKRKGIEAKIKQVYESVKIELFGSEISTSSNSKEFSNTNEQHKTIVINPKKQEDKKTSGFKPIPKRKSIENKSVVNVNGIENNLSKEINMQPTKTPTKPIVQHEDNNDDNSEKIKKKISKTNKNSMVHCDDPGEKFFRLFNSPTLVKSNNKNTGKILNKTTINDDSEQLVGLSRYLIKTPSKMFDSSPKGKKLKTIESEVKPYKLNNSDSNINYSEMNNVDKSSKSISTGCISNNTKTNMKGQTTTFTENCTVGISKVSDGEKNNTVHNKSIELLEPVQNMSSMDIISNPNSFSKNKINSSLDRSESSIVNHNSSFNNTSCITVTHDGTLDVQASIVCDPLNNMEYLKISRAYEVITEDDEREMVYLNVSEKFNFLDIPSGLNNVQSSEPITSPLITRNQTEVTPEIESGQLVNNKGTLKLMTSTPKDNVEIKNDKFNRSRRSPSLWNDSVHNYTTKHRGDRSRETRHWQNKICNKPDLKKYRANSSRYHDDRPQFYTRNHNQRIHYPGKREFCEDSVYDKYRNKHKDEKRRSNRDYSEGGNWSEENERYPTQKRISKYDFQKSNRTEDIAKKSTKRPADRTVYNQTPAKVSKVEHQLLLKNVNVDDFLSVVHGRK